MAATIRDVARLAGVGTGTVSRVINNQPNVDSATRARVLQAIGELEFRPSAVGRRLSTGRTGLIGVVAPFMTRPSAVERLRGIEGFVATTGYDMVVFNVETAARRESVVADLLRGDRVDGVVLLAVRPHAEEVAVITRTGIPVVLLDAHHARLDQVVINDVGGGAMAVRHLLDLGHRRIAYLGELPQVALNVPASRLRHRGAREALRQAGIGLSGAYTAIGESGPTRARELAARLLRLPHPPTGIVCASDHQALGALYAAHDLGFDVPGDVSVVGYDDLEIAAYADLTTVRQPLYESGMQAARLIVERIAHPRSAPVRDLVDVELVRRATTGPPPAATRTRPPRDRTRR
ncbi:MAG: LacI family DNA-binding transcriptional regulator [Chloroflexi bacterium]|nr:LacI family DNA-binding transcriptional regulator [Chloroflexota bacterium]